jgi:hypothetical protein
MIFFNRHLVTSWTFLVFVGKAFIHLEKVQTNTSKYRPGGGAGGVWHRDGTFPILSYIGEFGDIKMLGQGGLESYLP